MLLLAGLSLVQQLAYLFMCQILFVAVACARAGADVDAGEGAAACAYSGTCACTGAVSVTNL